eukprot:Nk52_evm2s1498 gene=Nk52_evmTU2s1498
MYQNKSRNVLVTLHKLFSDPTAKTYWKCLLHRTDSHTNAQCNGRNGVPNTDDVRAAIEDASNKESSKHYQTVTKKYNKVTIHSSEGDKNEEALLDNGAGLNYITKALVQSLKLSVQTSLQPLQIGVVQNKALNNASKNVTHSFIITKITLHEVTHTLKCWVVDNIPGVNILLGKRFLDAAGYKLQYNALNSIDQTDEVLLASTIDDVCVLQDIVLLSEDCHYHEDVFNLKITPSKETIIFCDPPYFILNENWDKIVD